MTSQGSAHGRFQRAIQRRNLFQAELAMRELGTPSLFDALAYLDLLAEVRTDKLERAAVRWHGRLEMEAATLTLAESQLAPDRGARRRRSTAPSQVHSGRDLDTFPPTAPRTVSRRFSSC